MNHESSGPIHCCCLDKHSASRRDELRDNHAGLTEVRIKRYRKIDFLPLYKHGRVSEPNLCIFIYYYHFKPLYIRNTAVLALLKKQISVFSLIDIHSEWQ